MKKIIQILNKEGKEICWTTEEDYKNMNEFGKHLQKLEQQLMWGVKNNIKN